MKFGLQRKCVIGWGLSAIFLFAWTLKLSAFSLLGPVQPWMQTTNGVILHGDIGGPMCISNEYRWNVPVVTYGFDKSFLDFFGTNGVTAVEGAIQILNNLPPASQITPSDFPFDSQQINYAAKSESLYDLKSETLSLLLEHMGLASPTRYIFVLKGLDSTSTNIVQRNFDPQTLATSQYVNETLYSYLISIQGNQNEVIPFAVDPFQASYNAVADFNLTPGGFYTGLTYDDVGGLAYLFSTNNINYENLLPNVFGVGANSNSLVNGAWRPGVDKITFVPQPTNLLGAFVETTNYFTDNYITNGVLQQQQVARIISQPDFLFCANDVPASQPEVLFFTRTGTTNWLNNAKANGNTNGAGPGVIQPQVEIVFNKLGLQIYGGNNLPDEAPLTYQTTFQAFGSFDNSANDPVVYPASQNQTNQSTFRLWLIMGNYPAWSTSSSAWNSTVPTGAQFLFQTSTNLSSWVTLFTNFNNGSTTTCYLQNLKSSVRFYRLIQQ